MTPQQAFEQIETWDSKKIKAVLAQAQQDASLQQALETRYMPVLGHIEATSLAALTTLPNKLTGKKALAREWQPDTVSAEVLATVPVERIALDKAKFFPTWLTCLHKLKELSLRECKALTMPAELGRLSNLRSLSFYKCALKEIPAPVANLVGLESLVCNSNELNALPDWLAKLPLQRLEVSFNKLTDLPQNIGKIGTLEYVDLAYNQLSSLPESLCQCTKIKNLSVQGNKKISALPEGLAQLKRLVYFCATSCSLTEVPEGLRACVDLFNVEISLNPIAALPDWIGEWRALNYLDIAHTQISQLPASIQKLPKLTGLNIEKTPLSQKDTFQRTLEKKEVAEYLQRLFSEKSDEMTAFYRDLESRDAAKIDSALQALAQQPTLWARAEKRYLPFIQTRLNDAKATLWQWAAVGISPKEEAKLLDCGVQKGDYITFLFMSDEECRLLVDFVGAIAKAQMDMPAFVERCRQCSKETYLMTVAQEQLSSLRNSAQAAAMEYGDGWFGRLLRAFASTSVNRLMFDHTNFELANGSPVLREFYFYLAAFALGHHYRLDIFQSTPPDLTEAFWLLPLIPDTQWGDTSVLLPPSPLSFSRSARIKEGDEGKWYKVASTP